MKSSTSVALRAAVWPASISDHPYAAPAQREQRGGQQSDQPKAAHPARSKAGAPHTPSPIRGRGHLSLESVASMRRRVTFSRNYALSLSRTCRCYCKYCAFATHKAHLYAPDEVERMLDEAARRHRVKELLVLTGERPEHNREVAARLAEYGHEDFTSYVVWVCERALERAVIPPDTNLGVLDHGDLARLRELSASQGLMLESVSERLMDTVHAGSPTKHPARRIETIAAAGELRIPFTSGQYRCPHRWSANHTTTRHGRACLRRVRPSTSSPGARERRGWPPLDESHGWSRWGPRPKAAGRGVVPRSAETLLSQTCNAGALTFHRFSARRRTESTVLTENVLCFCGTVDDRVIGLAIEVHRNTGPGLPEFDI